MKRIVVLYENPRFAPEITYTFCVLFSVLGLDFTLKLSEDYNLSEDKSADDLIVFYGNECPPPDSSHSIKIGSSDFFGNNYRQPMSLPVVPLRHTEVGLPVLFTSGSPEKGIVLGRSTRGIETNIDLVASSFFLLSCYEEMLFSEQDVYGRFPAEASLAVRQGFIGRPLVNEYAELLWSWISSLCGDFHRESPWGEHEYAFCLTHDIDHLAKKRNQQGDSRGVLSAIMSGHPHRAMRKANAVARGLLSRDPYDTFDYLLRLASDHNLASTYFFLTGRQPDGWGGGYLIDDPKLAVAVRKVVRAGCEVGLHTGYDSFIDGAAIREEVTLLTEKMRELGLSTTDAMGCRQHFLRWDASKSWSAREGAGVLYDSSLTFAGRPGFRAGLCHPFRPFDLKSRRVLDLYEIPLVVMDGTLTDQNYLGLKRAGALDTALSLLDCVRQFHGVFSILWHNSTLDKEEQPELGGVLEAILSTVRGHNPYAHTMRDTLCTFRQSTADKAYTKTSQSQLSFRPPESTNE